jgi:hypothetical protein
MIRANPLWPACALGVVAGVSAVAAVWLGWGGGGASSFWRERQASGDPPELWSVEAVPQPAGWAPVRLCTDALMRTGFAQPLPLSGPAPCIPVEPPRREGDRYAYRCTLGGAMQGVSSTVRGDPRRDFTATFTITDLSRYMTAGAGAEYVQVRRYRRLGACPAGWSVGDHTDRHGVRHAKAMQFRHGMGRP